MRALVITGLAACATPAPAFQCMPGNDAACIADDGTQGVCELTGNCAFPDNACGAGAYRYDASAQPGRGGICELSDAGPTMTALVPITAGHNVMFEIATGMPSDVVFDTEVPGTTHPFSLHWFGTACPPSSPTESLSMPIGCAPPVTSIHVTTGSGPFCLVIADDQAAQDQVGLRVFPNTASAMCAQ